MLKLKPEIDKINKTYIYKGRGKKLIFDPIVVKEEDYPKYKALGFHIFRCDICNSDSCYGDCNNNFNIDEIDNLSLYVKEEIQYNIDILKNYGEYENILFIDKEIDREVKYQFMLKYSINNGK